MSAQLFLNAGGSSIFEAASPQALRIRQLTVEFIFAAAAILLLVAFLTTYISIRYRSKGQKEDPVQITGNPALERWMVGVPLVLVIFFFFRAMGTMNAVLPDPRGQHPNVIITGHQWFWEAAYPGTMVTTANEIHLPVGKKLLLQLNAADVIHDWWVPALGGKMDMIPGRNNYLWLTIDRPGIYEGACSEFCGQQHAWMRIRVVAQSPRDYAVWLSNQAAGAHIPQDTLAKAGAILFLESTCSSCHRVRGTTAAGIAGPDLTHFGSRQTMLTGMLVNDSAQLTRWLTDPQQIKPGAHMPRFIFAKDSIRSLTAYLEQLK
jgi:cytochrome c oxidase subunit 2